MNTLIKFLIKNKFTINNVYVFLGFMHENSNSKSELTNHSKPLTVDFTPTLNFSFGELSIANLITINHNVRLQSGEIDMQRRKALHQMHSISEN